MFWTNLILGWTRLRQWLNLSLAEILKPFAYPCKYHDVSIFYVIDIIYVMGQAGGRPRFLGGDKILKGQVCKIYLNILKKKEKKKAGLEGWNKLTQVFVYKVNLTSSN